MKLRIVMVPLDGSTFAEVALPLATALARRAGATLRLVLVHGTSTGAGDDAAAAQVALQDHEREYLRTTASRLDPGGAFVPEVDLLEGAPGPSLAAAVGSLRADLVVMATHGRGAVGRAWLGSVADYLLRHLHTPILLVRPGESGRVDAGTRLERILVPLDTSSTSEEILETVLAIADPGATITLAHVVEPVLGTAEPTLPFPMPMDPKLLADLRGLAQARLDRVAETLRARGVTVSGRVLTGVGPAHLLLEEAERGRYDLVAMTTHGQGGLRRLLLGSVTDKVVRGATGPVLVSRPGAML
ncbi:MAG TPA: universal stress protein [Gemmatimonadales bacterium]